MTRPKILVATAEPAIVHSLASQLKSTGYTALTALDHASALLALREETPVLLIVGEEFVGNGEEMLRFIRRTPGLAEIGIIVLGERRDDEERVHLLDAGADDCLPSAVGQAELTARIHALLRRRERPMPNPVPAPMRGQRCRGSADVRGQALAAGLAAFEPIDLAEMGRMALLNRVESKYVLPRPLLDDLLNGLSDFYSVLVIEDHCLNHYRTLYFDTADFAMYRRHHAGALNRYKVRARQYVDTQTSFFEVKFKTNKRRTIKSRLPTTGLPNLLDAELSEFLRNTCPYPATDLQPCLWNRYLRATLANKEANERVTLDFEISFAWGEREACCGEIVIAEVKQEGPPWISPFARLMREHHLCSTGFSKYCMGMSLLYPDVKKNRFKPKQRLIAKLQGKPYVAH
ncbi:MAG: VTC domain-containing protein [Caldilineaceae bacterium]|nr:VTC domain-containing protein [Caldilineaceae bacterium]